MYHIAYVSPRIPLNRNPGLNAIEARPMATLKRGRGELIIMLITMSHNLELHQSTIWLSG